MDPVTAIVTALIVLVVLVVIGAVLVRRWNAENARRYPERVSSRLFEMNRKPRH